MVALADAFLRLRPDTSGFKGEAERGISSAGLGKLGETHGKAFGSNFSGAFRGVVAGLGAVFAGAGLVEFLKASIAEQREAIRVGNLTNAVIKSTGGAAHVTAGQVGDLANALSLKTGVDDEAIQSGENLLLTFTKVRNEAGKGNDIFNQATAAVEDMAAAMNNGAVTTDGLKTSSIQVGKALSDPIKGITALTRAGVVFSDQQKEQIKHFVESGNIMGAQKIILAELSKEFGGAAAAAADPAQKMQVAWKNFEEQIGGLVLPALTVLATFLTGTILPVVQNRIVPAVQDMAGWFKLGFIDGKVGVEGFAGAIGNLGAAVRVVWDQAKNFWSGLTGGSSETGGALQHFGGVIHDQVVPAVLSLVDLLGQLVGWLSSGTPWAQRFDAAMTGVAAAVVLYNIAVKAAAVSTALWGAAITAIAWVQLLGSVRTLRDLWAAVSLAMDANPIGLIVLALAALVVGVIYAYNHFAWFRTIVQGAWQGIATAAMWAWNNVLKPTIDALVVAYQAVATGALWLWHNVLEPVWQGIAAVVSWAWNNIIYPAFQAFNLVMSAIGTVAMWLWHNIIEPVWRGISAAISVAATILGPIFAVIGAAVGILGDIFMFLWRNVVEPVWAGIKFASQVAAVFLEIIWVAIQIGIKAVEGVFMVLWDVVKFVWSAIQIAIQAAWVVIKPIWDALVAVIRTVIIPGFQFLWQQIEAIWHGISSVISAVWTGAIKPVLDAFGNFIKDHVEPAFRGGVHGIEVAWNLIKDIAKKPVNFVIGVINQGFIHPFNTLAGFFGVKDRVGDIPQLAAGGRVHGPGGPRDDMVPALLSNREFVVNARDTEAALPILTWINSGGLRGLGSVKPRMRYPGDLSEGIPRLAGGGLVGWLTGIGKELWDVVTDPAKFIGDLVNSLLQGIPGGNFVREVITGGAHKLVGWLVGWITGQGGGSGTPASLGAVSNLIRAQAGKPYIWSGAGPVGFDCSGIVSLAYNALKGRSPYHHTFSTSDEGRFLPIRGMGGLLTAGWSNPGEGGPGGGPNGVGHTAGWLGPGANGSSGLRFESTGSTGVRIGNSVTPISSFAHVGHFDRGGQLAPGWNLAFNGTGRGEPVGGALDLSDSTIAKLGRAIGREISGVGRGLTQAARAY